MTAGPIKHVYGPSPPTARPEPPREWVVLLPYSAGALPLFGAAAAGGLRRGTHDTLFWLSDGDLGEADAELARRSLHGSASELSRLRGAFTLIAYDAAQGRGMAARDPLGTRPLFYAQTGDGVLVSPSLEALLAHSRVPRSPNRAALADHLCQRWPDSAETFYSTVRRVPPGHVLRSAGRHLRLERYFRPGAGRAQGSWIDADGAARLDALLEQAVARAAADAPAAIFLSGGIDSVTVAAVAADRSRARQLPAPLALSLTFPHEACNEEFVQRRVAQQLSLRQIVRDLETAMGGGVMLRRALELAADWPAPLLNFWLPAYLRLARLAKVQGCATVLTGGGGDDWLNVSPLLAADLLARGDLAGVVRLWRAGARSHRLSPARLGGRLAWDFGLRPHLSGAAAHALRAADPEYLRAWRRRHIVRATPCWIAPDASLRSELAARGEAGLPPAQGPYGYYFREMQAGLDHALTSMEMEEWDEIGRRAGVRIAEPFWDVDVVDLLHGVDPRALLDGGRSKALVRSTLERRFPGLGFGTQKKVVSSAYFSGLLREGAGSALETFGTLQALGDLGIVDSVHAERALRDAVARDDHRALHYLWTVLGLEAWARNHY